MEYFTAICPRKARVYIDGSYQGENKEGETLHVFQCSAGLHDISLECEKDKASRRLTQRVMISGTTGISPLQLHFLFEL
jgi:hypothetical protein